MGSTVTEYQGGAFDVLDEGSLPRPIGLHVLPVGPRFFLLFAVIVATMISDSIIILAAQTFVLVFLALVLRRLKPLVASWKFVAWVSLSLLIVYAWAFPGSTTYFWIFGIEGFFQGLFIATRLLLFVSTFYLFLITTGPLAIVRFTGDLNENLGIMLSLTLGIVPVMQQQMNITLQAQQARGMKVEGNLLIKLKSYVAVMIPVVVKSLVRAYQMAILLQVRGFGSGRRIKIKQRINAPIIAAYLAGVAWVVMVILARWVIL